MGKEEEKPVEYAAETAAEAAGERPASGLRRWKRRLMALAIVVAVLWGLVAAIPHCLCLITFPEVFVDLSPNMKDTPPELFPDQTLTAKYGISRQGGGYEITAKGRVVGWPFTATAHVNLAFRFFGVEADGSAEVRLDGSQYGVTATFSASVPGGWSADVQMPEVPLADSDPFLRSILARHPDEIVRKIIFDGIISLTAHAEQQRIFRGIPQWQAKARIKNLDASVEKDGKPLRIENFRIGVGAKGVAEHIDIDPMFAHIDRVEGAGCVLTNTFASIRATETAFLVTEAGADFCGGKLHLYALFLDPKKLNAGATIYIDNVDAGKVLSHLNGFKGEASGTLNGKIPFRLANGNELHFGGCYLHSVPGEIGNLKLYDPTPITDNLMLSGLTKDSTDNVANALSDLDYSALKIGLVPEEDGQMALSMKLEGTATRGDIVVPVSFTVTFHGQIEQLINTGLRVATRKEHKQQ